MRGSVALAALVLMASACSDDSGITSPENAVGAAFSAVGGGGSVYSMSNAPGGNSVLAFHRASDGSLSLAAQYPTGGNGSGGGLGNQGAVTVSHDGRWLFVVNAGSNSLSVFRRAPDGSLTLTDTEASGGVRPVSVASHGAVVYALNAGSGSIAGFTLSSSGDLSALPGSIQSTTGAAAGDAQISFTTSGRQLVVTERLADRILVFNLDSNNVASAGTVNAAVGTTPFGFDFDNRGRLVTSNAMGGAALAGTVSSYLVQDDGSLAVLDGAVPDFQSAPCWLVTSRDGRFAYTTNAGSRSVSAFRIGAHGELLLQPENAATTGNPTDAAVTRSGSPYLYVLNSAAGAIDAFRILSDGSLEAVAGITGMPAGMNGLAAI